MILCTEPPLDKQAVVPILAGHVLIIYYSAPNSPYYFRRLPVAYFFFGKVSL